MRSDELERLLEEAGAAEVPPVDAVFADALEQRLRSGTTVVDPGAVRAARRPSPWARVSIAGLAAAAVVAVALLAWPGGRSDGGDVRTDGIFLGPTASTTDPTSTSVSTSTSTVDAPATTAAPAPAPTAAPTTTTTVEPTTTTTGAPTTTTPPPPATAQTTLRLAATPTERGVALRWSPYRDDDARFAAYLVLRSPPPERAEYPVSGNTVVVERIDDVNRTALHDPRRPGAVDPAYRVVAVDAEGNELARSPAVRPARR